MIQKTMETIEGYEFDALLNVASSFKMLKKIARKQTAFKDLVAFLTDSPENVWLVLKRTVDLSNQPIDPQYENPADIALTVYLLALSLVDLDIAETASSFVLQAQNCWWSVKFAACLMSEKNVSDRVSIQSFEDFKEKFADLFARQNTKASFSSAKPQFQIKTHSVGKDINKAKVNALRNVYNIQRDEFILDGCTTS
ncbi:MAG: hypothetical protein AB4290_13425 [Spirulina sp.]